jgi:hypothetical protein
VLSTKRGERKCSTAKQAWNGLADSAYESPAARGQDGTVVWRPLAWRAVATEEEWLSSSGFYSFAR